MIQKNTNKHQTHAQLQTLTNVILPLNHVVDQLGHVLDCLLLRSIRPEPNDHEHDQRHHSAQHNNNPDGLPACRQLRARLTASACSPNRPV
jgi:hypothetical protein